MRQFKNIETLNQLFYMKVIAVKARCKIRKRKQTKTYLVQIISVTQFQSEGIGKSIKKTL